MYIGIDIGGTSCRITATDDLTNIEQLEKRGFLIHHDFDQDFETIKQFIHELSPGKIDGIGIGTPGSLNLEKTMVIGNTRNLTEWKNKPLTDLFATTFKTTVALENDAVAAALGEAYYGSGKDHDFTYIIWGTGVGGATVTWNVGKPVVEKLNWYDFLNTWEDACGGNDIKKNYGKPAESLSEEEWDKVMQDFSKELHAFIAKTHPSLMIFGGGIAVKQAARVMKLTTSETTLKVSTLGEDGGLYGALSLLK